MDVLTDPDVCYRAVRSRDSRFDGRFITAVTSTGIYCRPSCPATTPKRAHVRFFMSTAGAQLAGFRACLRCLPDAAPGSPEWNLRADLVGRAMRLIADGVVEREGVGGLAQRLGYSERQLHRQLTGELGAGPLALARARRAQTARTLIETTGLPFTDVAFAAGFSSVRQFNDTVREVFAKTPSELRARRKHIPEPAAGAISLRLPYRPPLAAAELWGFLAARAVPGVEGIDDQGWYHRALRLPNGPATVALRPAADFVAVELRLTDLRDLGVAVQRCRRLLDLDSDPVAVDELLGADPVLAPLVSRRPGLRVPGAVDGAEIVVRAILGQQVSVAAARGQAASLAARFGEPLPEALAPADHPAELRFTFPSAAVLATADDAGLPMPQSRRVALRTVCAAIAADEVGLDAGADPHDVKAALQALPGIGPWTAGYIAMRALASPDELLATDLAVARAAKALGIDGLVEHAEQWRPWRSYAVMHLYAAGKDLS